MTKESRSYPSRDDNAHQRSLDFYSAVTDAVSGGTGTPAGWEKDIAELARLSEEHQVTVGRLAQEAIASLRSDLPDIDAALDADFAEQFDAAELRQLPPPSAN